jgi:hypothetical protein
VSDDTTAQQSGLFQYLTVGLLQPTLDSPASRPTRAIACPANAIPMSSSTSGSRMCCAIRNSLGMPLWTDMVENWLGMTLQNN